MKIVFFYPTSVEQGPMKILCVVSYEDYRILTIVCSVDRCQMRVQLLFKYTSTACLEEIPE